MNLLVIGATRGIGRSLVELALDADHTVTALVRNPERMPVRHDRLNVINGDIRDREGVFRENTPFNVLKVKKAMDLNEC